ncbi:MAG TPA: hydrogenase formation protein HypD [Candidatus Moranbacteria bacterium]|nr:hydrogenase formation protein HypD [Candidatus Moranbacteria bacterium]HBT46128.1 hydrogenase formation protein HypD [Candidatus Moranbacteria bacterium]
MKKEIKLSEDLIKKIHNVANEIGRDIVIMEVCGTHTQTVSRSGIRKLMPKNVRLLTGPGCPVCVTAQEDIDAVIHLAKAGIPIATYGDMLRVPGFFGSLEQVRAQGAKVFSVYSVEEALALKKDYPELVFFGLGFDTTTPMTAMALKKGLTVYSTHKLFLPAMDALLSMGEIKIDGFLSPGHVSAIVGIKPYEHMNVAQVITGFETQDVLVGIYMLICQIRDGRREVENEYVRLVKQKGNPVALKMIADTFEIGDGNWRGFGIIPNSGLEVKNPKLNAKIKYKDILSKVDYSKSKKPTGCRCGEVIRGLIMPEQCPMFGKICTPEKPYGPCMVSDEGGCNTEYRYN